MTDNAIEIKKLRKIYDNKFEALKGINLNIPKGSFYGLLGPNGAGKTTTIGAISGLVNYKDGNISVMGYDNKKDYKITRNLIGLSPQELNFDVFFPIKKVLEFQAGYYGLSFKEAKEQSEIMLEQFGLKEKQNNACRELSGGMKRRLQIAKALVHNPEILILDEPTAGVDIELRHMLWDFLKKINKQGKTILLTTHYIEEAEKLCDYITIINDGKIIKSDTKENLLKVIGKKTVSFVLEKQLNDTPIQLKEFNPIIETDKLLLHYDKNKNKLKELITILNDNRITFNEINTYESDLEDVFLELIKK